MKKPKIYIAAPLFNGPQLKLIGDIEDALTRNNYEFFSPRLHSEGLLPPKERRREYEAWKPLFDMNLEGLAECDMMIAVLCYYVNPYEQVTLKTNTPNGIVEKPLHLPDSGTVWEMGHFFHQEKPIIGYYPGDANYLNVMLTHSTKGIIQSIDDLDTFLKGSYGDFNWGVVKRTGAEAR